MCHIWTQQFLALGKINDLQNTYSYYQEDHHTLNQSKRGVQVLIKTKKRSKNNTLYIIMQMVCINTTNKMRNQYE